MTADPWALLREAKRLIAANRLMLGHYSGVREVGSLEDRIDAALAESRDSETDVVEWKKGVSEDDYTYAQLDSDTYVDVIEIDGQWRWSALREQGCGGYCATEAEAKEAAIAATRGMK
jgi:hypothetical protein